MEAYKFTFSQPGALTPPINYIRNVFSAVSKGKTQAPRTIDIPVLLLWVSGAGVQACSNMLEFHREMMMHSWRQQWLTNMVRSAPTSLSGIYYFR